MLLPELRAEVARYAKKMYDSHLVHATQGNLSARDPSSGLICITPSGTDFQLLQAEDVVVDEHGKVVEGRWHPSPLSASTLPFHREKPLISCILITKFVHYNQYPEVMVRIFYQFTFQHLDGILCLHKILCILHNP